ncbi:MAG: enoyl-[acyl-carrier-protein] reductase FabL [Dehalococcoidia bacterium]|nr:enoyl-[acyl-carrier-protein] reductase FabL [Dehalococcoidia bacterium]
MSSDSLKGKVALITGGSRGIGRAITLRLAAEGADVVINYFRKRDTAEATAEEARKKGVRAHLIKADVGDEEKVSRMFAEITEKFGRLDILISNAASGVARSALDLDTRGWDWAMNINARAFLLCAQKSVPLMKDGGKMISITSLGSRFVLPSYTAIGASKAALETVTRYLAVELAPKGISVNAVAASAVETEAIRILSGGEGLPPVWCRTPVGRMVEPEDIANAVAFLCSDQAFMIRGQVITVDGGSSLVQTIPDKPC